MKLILLAFFFLIHTLSYGQIEKKVEMKPFQSLWRIDDNVYYEIDKKLKKIYWNGKAIDSAGVDLEGKVFSNNGLVGFHRKKNEEKHFYSIDSFGKLKYLNKIKDYQLFTTRANFFISKVNDFKQGDDIYKYNERNFYRLDLKSATPLDFYDINKVSGLDSMDARDLCNLYELSNNKIIATICDCSSECLFYQYYLVDIMSGETRKINLNTKEPLNDELYRVRTIASDNNHIQIEVWGAEKKENNGIFIYDLDFKEISKALDHETSAIGANYKDGKYLSSNVKTILDDGKEVIVAYKFSMPLERSMYRIYSNLSLFQEDIIQCNQYGLDLLRNMLFAKHNYKFDTDFYQAYFNYYKFYNVPEKRKNRTKEVNHLLTESDKKNLSVINQALKKKKK